MTHFELSVDDLNSLFDIDNIWREKSIQMLDKWGRIEQLQKLLHTDFKKGLCQSSSDRKARIEVYGDNRPVVKHPKTIVQQVLPVLIQMCDVMEDRLIRAMICAAILSIIFGLFKQDGWIEGASIIIGVAVLTATCSVGNHLKNKEFSKTSDILTPDIDVKVIREGKLTKIPSKQLLVGDILYVQCGDVLTIDGILIDGKDIATDESMLTGQPSEVKKKVPITYQKSQKANPFLLSGSKLYDGKGLVVVAAVGRNSSYGQLKLKIQCSQDETPLQRKLGDVTDKIGRVTNFPNVICLIILLSHYIYECYSQDSFIDIFFSVTTIHQLLKYLNITLCLLMISVPEGLPCCVFLIHCLHLNKMLEEKILVRYLNAIEAMASVDNICTDVTDTLIEDTMSVTRIFIQERNHYMVDKKAMLEKTCKLFSLCISCNTTSNPIFGQQEKEKWSDKVIIKSQRALLEAVHKLGYDYQMLRSKDRIKKTFSFDNERKKVAALYEDQNGRLLIFVRGSEDMMVQYYSHFINKDGAVSEINHQYLELFNEAKSSYIAGGMRIIMLAYKEVGSIPEDWSQIEKDLIVLAMVGIKNPLKKGIVQAASIMQKANIIVRIISGYQKIAAINAAKQIGILSPDWQHSQGDLTVMQGKECKQLIGGIIVDKQDYYQRNKRVGDIQNFKLIDDKLRVLVRQYPEGKYYMIVGLQNLERVVAMVDDGTRYPYYLKTADAAIAMKSGSEDAKEMAGIILLDDNFCSIVNVVKWGRNVYEAVRKYLQFQLTLIFVSSFMVLIGCVCNKQYPLSPFQIIWISMLAEIFAPLALLSESPSQQILKRKPQSKKDPLITKKMWRFMVSQGIVQVVILCVILFKGHEIFAIPSSIGARQWSAETSKHYSIFFNVFFMLQICNLINARRLKDEYNIFDNFLSNKFALIVILISVIIQLALMQYGGRFMKCAPLNLKEILACLLMGSLSMISCLAVKIVAKKMQKSEFDNKIKDE